MSLEKIVSCFLHATVSELTFDLIDRNTKDGTKRRDFHRRMLQENSKLQDQISYPSSLSPPVTFCSLKKAKVVKFIFIYRKLCEEMFLQCKFQVEGLIMDDNKLWFVDISID
jgi:hypothetical protein